MVTSTLFTIGRWIRGIIGWLALGVGFYFLCGWIGSSIPRNPNWRETRGGIEIMVETNGVHTAIIMPLVTPQKDWRTDFPTTDIGAPDRPYTHVSVSWGDREFFLNTPTWADLSPKTVLRIATSGGEGLLHVAHYVSPAPSATVRPLRISKDDYTVLVSEIEERMAEQGSGRKHRGYGDDDVFYEAPGTYTPFNTCNQWTSDVLADTGIRTGWWTPFEGGVMKWVPQLPAAGQSKP